MDRKKLKSQALFRRRLLSLRKREALRLFPTSCAFLSVVSAFTVSHKFLTFAGLSRCSNGTKPKPPSALLLLLRSVRHWRWRILNLHNLERPKERGQIDHVVRC
jgi:hypothetical protein